ncbi:cupin domain-containing protein [Acaryochloris sp. IP29b_bin.137]|uniref:cupin domain-containing protein n=1 Tax=Acaryochloris sp. IP29b_bin.137 TaxID=2969217 RepID=UPI002605E0A4|nr:cupin domain-containing protein [Acaryochloris sp. IP29b_bin.137]
MTETNPYLLRADAIEQTPEFAFQHPLNPNSEIYLRDLGAKVGLERAVLRLSRVPPGKESFIYHAHHHEEEFIYILSGRGIAEIEDQEYEVGPGDFMGFPTPSVAHHLRNPFEEDLVYLMGGEHRHAEIGEFPRLGKRIIRDGDDAYFVDIEAIQPFFPQKKE